MTNTVGLTKIPFSILVPETNDVTLGERCRRANAIYAKNNKEAFLLSVHANAGGDTGWECYTSVSNTKSDAIATIFCDFAKQKFNSKKNFCHRCNFNTKELCNDTDLFQVVDKPVQPR